jgi:hypothetical protein
MVCGGCGVLLQHGVQQDKVADGNARHTPRRIARPSYRLTRVRQAPIEEERLASRAPLLSPALSLP